MAAGGWFVISEPDTRISWRVRSSGVGNGVSQGVVALSVVSDGRRRRRRASLWCEWPVGAKVALNLQALCQRRSEKRGRRAHNEDVASHEMSAGHSEQCGARSVSQRSCPKRLERVWVGMPVWQERTPALLGGACPGTAEPRHSQGAVSSFRREELSLGVTAGAGTSCSVGAEREGTRAGGTGGTGQRSVENGCWRSWSPSAEKSRAVVCHSASPPKHPTGKELGWGGLALSCWVAGTSQSSLGC